MKFFLFLFLLFSVVSYASPPGGIIKGVVKDKKTGETLVGVNVYLEVSLVGGSTNLNGEFEINHVQAGTYRVVASMISYKKVILENVRVNNNNVTTLNIEMEEEITQMQEVVIVDRRTTSSEISIINSIKSTNLVANGISSQQILKSQDRDASEVIRRVPGITLFNGKFIIVRGLNQRYNTVFLNGASTPSSEPDARAFSFDIIPSSLIDNIMVYKSPSPELPADFSGAFIDVFTRNTPSRNSEDVSLSFSYRAGTTFRDFYKYKGGAFDFLGIDDGTRSLPSNFPSTSEYNRISGTYTPEATSQTTQLGRELNNTWTAQAYTALPDIRMNMAITRKFKIGKVLGSNVSAISYTNTNLFLPIHRTDYQVYNFTEDKPNLNFDFHDNQYRNTAKTSVIVNLSFLLKPGNSISFQNLLNQIGFTQTTLREGTEYYSSQQYHSSEFYFQSRTTYSGQLAGEHNLSGESAKLKWTAGYSYANMNEPMEKRLTTILNTNSGDPYYNQYGLAIGNSASPKYAGIVYQYLKENLFMGKVDFTQQLAFKNFKPELRLGIYSEYKSRSFDARLLGYVKSHEDQFDQSLPYKAVDSIFSERYINNSDGIKLAESTNPSDSYDADNTLLAGYILLKLPFTSWMTLYGGLRIEKNSQGLSSFSSDLGSLPVHFNLDRTDLFPSANITFDISDKSLIRVTYGRSINRPEFREIAPFNFYMFQENASFAGNPELTDAFIQNFDIRYELYPTLSDMFTLGVFYKKFIHPIEITYINSGSGLAYGPVNAKGAYSFGAEVELRKSFSSWKQQSGFLHNFKDFTIVFNASYITSQVQFNPGSYERNRYLQGQSPYIINAGLYYQEDKTGWMTSLLYNVLGKRIIIVGQPNQDPKEDIPDMYEMPFNSLDLTVSKKLGKHLQVKGGIQNLLDEEVLYRQTVKFNTPGKGDVTRHQPTLSYSPGRYYTLGIGLTF